MSTILDIEKILIKLQKRRSIFHSEADFQLELGWIIKEEYPTASVRMEYCPSFDDKMHIDILVIIDDLWIPIELKYKTKSFKKDIDNEYFNLKNHSAKDVNCYLYLKDIQRIEKVRENTSSFAEGYTIFITNDLSYSKKPLKDNCIYKDFSLEEGAIKTGALSWSADAGTGTTKGISEPITLTNTYPIHWNVFSKVDTQTFLYTISKIEK